MQTEQQDPGPAMPHPPVTPSAPEATATAQIADLARGLRIGDLVFIRVDNLLYRRVAGASATWTNHVGIVIDVAGTEPVIAESRVPRSTATTLARYLARSAGGRVTVRRLTAPLTESQNAAIVAAARQRFGTWYHLGFKLHSARQFCSKYVREVLLEATGIEVGDVENFATLLKHNPQVDLRFWRWWYFGCIPWERKTVTPASQLHSAALDTVFDGCVTPAR